MNKNALSLRVLLVPDSIYWVTGTIAKSIVRFNPWIEGTILSGTSVETIFRKHPELISNFDLVHFICPYISKNWLAPFKESIPCVTSHHHVTDWQLIKHNLEGDAIVVGSPEWKQDIEERGARPEDVFCIPYGVDAELFKPASNEERAAIRKRLKIPEEATAIGFFAKKSSNDDDRKGTDTFIKAVLELGQRLENVTVLIVGPGWEKLVQLFKRSNIRCVWFPFIRDYENITEMYAALDFYWVTARVEGGPVTLLEAMSSGVCSVTTPVGLARLIVRDGENAALVQMDDVEGFVSRTIELTQNPALRKRIIENARQTILEEMHVGITTRKVGGLYLRAMENFAARKKCEVPVAIREMLASSHEKVADDKSNSIPLLGLPHHLHRRVRMMESLEWGEHLVLHHNQRGAALRIIIEEWIKNPLSLQPARVLLRRFLPLPVVKNIVKLKNRRQSVTIASAKL